jgi:molybdenum cofactor cytidylyltransferase
MPSFAIIPAAGKSARMGRSKLLLPWQGRTLLETVLHEWLRSDITRVVIVVRPGDHDVIDRLANWDVDVVVPKTAPAEMRDSVGLALDHIAERYAPSADDVWLLAPADLPRLSAQTVNQLLVAHRFADPSILVPIASGRRGHPVLFPWTLAAAVSQLPADRGVNALLERFATRELPVASDAGFDDLDEPADYRRLLDDPP